METDGDRQGRKIFRTLLVLLSAGAALQLLAAGMFRRLRNRHAGDRKHFIVTQGGLQLKPLAGEIADSVVSVLMGGVVLDLREVLLEETPARIDMLCIMGGVEVLAPPEWRIDINVQPVMGGVQDRRGGDVDPERPVDLVLSGRVVMGGLDVATSLPGRNAGWIADTQ